MLRHIHILVSCTLSRFLGDQRDSWVLNHTLFQVKLISEIHQ